MEFLALLGLAAMIAFVFKKSSNGHQIKDLPSEQIKPFSAPDDASQTDAGEAYNAGKAFGEVVSAISTSSKNFETRISALHFKALEDFSQAESELGSDLIERAAFLRVIF